ncbi:MAG: hemerythrin domain-containing protein [Betaproteobacteria bacterium]
MQAIRIIREEHQSLAAVLHGLLYLVREISAHRMHPDFPLLGAMVYYIDTFPERCHHPKEDDWLFRLLQQRYPPAGEVLERLRAEHRAGATKLKQLEQALLRYEQGGQREFPIFVAAVEGYVAFERNHMRCEETEVMPLAQEYLTPADWEEIDAAFLDHTDPLSGEVVRDDFRELFRRIVNLAPPPIGVGPANSLL